MTYNVEMINQISTSRFKRKQLWHAFVKKKNNKKNTFYSFMEKLKKKINSKIFYSLLLTVSLKAP